MNRAKPMREIVAHHLRLFGVRDAGVDSVEAGSSRLLLLAHPVDADVDAAERLLANDGVVIALRPARGFCARFGVECSPAAAKPPAVLKYHAEMARSWARLRTLHEVDIYRHASGTPVVTDASDQQAWMWLPSNRGGILFVGTDIAEDLTRYRQGDPGKEKTGSTEPVWGYAGERALHLFEEQIAGESPAERHADWWAMALAQCAADRLGRPLVPLLPGGAPGAVLITGDDDQAYLEKYDEQLALLAGTPITYFLHPKTRHTRRTLERMQRGAPVDLGIHPDALDAPHRYGDLLREQVEWFQRLVQAPPVSLRNHGFLSSGYWRHLPHWIEQGIRISSNLPGLDGRVLNGSLLPARMVYEGALTSHWSLLTAIGDGVVFAQGLPDERAADCVRKLVQHIRDSRVPGIVVLNLHPQNVGETRSMHRAALEAVAGGFHAWTLRECVEWFQQRDGSLRGPAASGSTPMKRIAEWFR